MILFTMLLIPMIVAFGFFIFGGKKITFVEFLIQNVAQILIMSCFAFSVSCSNTADVEVWNGRVNSKYSEKVSCSHSYQCNCRTICSGSGKHRSCRRVCSTCYEHGYDVDWVVKTTNNERIEINRVNRQGTSEPPRWSAVQIGEPTSRTHSYENYVKAAPDSLFRKQGLVEKYQKHIPKYPDNVYDYYKLDRIVTVGGFSVTELQEWNKQLSEINADLGRKKQVNLIAVFSKNLSQDYFYALEQAWIGAKKNDIVLVINFDDNQKITWVNVMAWTENKITEIMMRDYVLGLGVLDREKILSGIVPIIENNYKRKPMKEFEYLKNTMTPTVGQWVWAMVVGLISSIGLGIFMLKNDYQ